MSEQKAALRAQALERRDGIDLETRIEGSLALVEHGLTLDALADPAGKTVAGYHPIRSEMDPRPLMAACAARGARLCLPVVLDKTTIVFRELIRGAPLIECGFGTVGPGPDAPELDPDILLMPLSVFDQEGGRIGYGAGHYDRAIARLLKKGASPILLGIAFSLQEAHTVPTEAHDQPLSAIITETGTHVI
ncbi:MAG: 5-formyltetrahydrofolate cyclo-ligase [Pseudomonadota bacterium]